MRFAHGETLTVLPAPTRDRHGDATGTASGVDVPGCAVWPAGSTEQTSGDTGPRDTVIGGYEVLMPVGTAVKAIDQLRWRGEEYNVDGDPERFQNPFTGTEELLVRMRKVTG
jgi:hypothetical protein